MSDEVIKQAAERFAKSQEPGRMICDSPYLNDYRINDAYNDIPGEQELEDLRVLARAYLELSARTEAVASISAEDSVTRRLIAEKIADRIMQVYISDRAGVAKLCDEQIDQTGNLLGWIRAYTVLSNEGGK